MKDAAKGINSVENAVRILKSLQAAEEPINLTALATSVDMTPSAARNYLRSLVRTGLVISNERGTYELGPALVGLGLVAMRRNDEYRVITRTANELSELIGISTVVGAWTDYGPASIYKSGGRQRGPLDLRVGEMSLMDTAIGRICLALADPVAVEQFLVTRHPDDMDKAERLRSETEETLSEVGYLDIDLVNLPGYRTLAAPIYSVSGNFRYCLSFVGPNSLFDASVEKTLVTQLKNTTATLSSHFGAPSYLLQKVERDP